MTTPTDAIAGLSESLKGRAAGTGYGGGDPLCAEAAAQLDSLLKEREDQSTQLTSLRADNDKMHDLVDQLTQVHHDAEAKCDALQARVKELAELHAQQAELASKSIRRLAELAEPGAIGAFASRDHWQSRALRAEQERDEAVTSTRYKIFDNLLGAYIGADNEQLRAAIGNFAFMSFPEYRDSLRKTAEECRLSAGPEKEKKE